jgi:hypothetical protein
MTNTLELMQREANATGLPVVLVVQPDATADLEALKVSLRHVRVALESRLAKLIADEATLDAKIAALRGRPDPHLVPAPAI